MSPLNALIGLALYAVAAHATEKPNIVLILADDLGYGDVRALNPDSALPTPNLDRLVREGVAFTDAHTPSAVCTPTRYGLLTGRYAWRTRLKRGVLFFPYEPPLIERDRLTLGGLLQQHGYRTACIGKWHLGVAWSLHTAPGKPDLSQPLKVGPTDFGFDEYFGILGSLDMRPIAFYRDHTATAPITAHHPGGRADKFMRPGPMAEGFDVYAVMDTLTTEAMAFIQRNARTEQPFFLYFPLSAPHKPVMPAPRFAGKTQLGVYGDFVHQCDWSIGQVLDALDEAGVVNDTLVIVTSDNGSFMYLGEPGTAYHTQDQTLLRYDPRRHRPNGPWRGTKADIWEAGHRVPFFARWPSRIKPGARCAATIGLVDTLATVAELLDAELPADAAKDSHSYLPLFNDPHASYDRPPLVLHSGNGMFAIRDGDWKLVAGNGSGGREKPAGKPFKKPYQLFNLKADPAEQRNVISAHPDVAARLEKALLEIKGGD